MLIEQLIGDLLLRHNCVVVPAFGGFVAKQMSAVIDYKTGGHQEKYKEQVSNYCFILKEMGYEQVTGHLIYLEPFEYEKVI
mgnify:CR=1 FL=1